MTNVTEMKPGTDQVDAGAVRAENMLRRSYGAKVCPVMSIGADKFAGGGILTGMGEQVDGPKEAQVAACVGPACQFFVITAVDDHDRPTNGGCGPALLPNAIISLQHTIAAALEAMLPKSNEGKS